MPGPSEHCKQCEAIAELLGQEPNCDGLQTPKKIAPCPWLMHGVIPVIIEEKMVR